MTALLITVHVIACLTMIIVVLLQAGRGADMGAAFGGSSSAMFGSGSSANPLARVTTITAIAFMTTSLLLAIGSARRASVFDSTPEPLVATPQAESSDTAAAPFEAAPVAEAEAPAGEDAGAALEEVAEIPAVAETAPADAAPAPVDQAPGAP